MPEGPKVAIVTGGNRGIGFEIVRALCTNFGGVVCLTSRNTEKGQRAVKKLLNEGFTKIQYFNLDIDDEASVWRLRNNIMKLYEGFDLLVNNAGVSFPWNDYTPFHLQAKAAVGTNFFGTLLVLRSLLPIMRANSRIVNMTSYIGSLTLERCSPLLQSFFRSDSLTIDQLVEKMNEFVFAAEARCHLEKGWPDTAYGVSKIGVTALTRIYAKILRENGKNILINACCPGWTRTELADPRAPKTPRQGAETPLYLALLPPAETEPNGQLLWDKSIQHW